MNYPGKRLWAIVLIGAAGAAQMEGGPSAIGIREEKVIAHAEKIGANLADNVLRGNAERFVDYTGTSGVWNTKSDSTWCSGFIPGMFWYLYEMTGKSRWRDDALHWTEGVRSRATATDNDTGFQIFESFGHGYLVDETLREAYKPVMLQGAATLVEQRYNAGVGCFRSWAGGTSNPTSLPFEVNIDQMMNLELILWAGLNGGPTEYIDYAISHADKTWANNVREDGSTFHVVSYNLDGSVASKRTHQGWQTDSTWSRGQAWAVYGYTLVYMYTGLPRMLERAEACYDYFLEQTRESDWRLVPFSDFDAPLDGDNPRDTSASAIVASAALELYGITGKGHYLSDAELILDTLSSPQYLSIFTNYQSILMAGSEKWGRPEVGASFGDFYFLEAVWLWSQIEQDPGVVTGAWVGFDILDGQYVDTDGWIGWLNAHAAPYVYSYTWEGWLYADEDTVSPSGGWFYRVRE